MKTAPLVLLRFLCAIARCPLPMHSRRLNFPRTPRRYRRHHAHGCQEQGHGRQINHPRKLATWHKCPPVAQTDSWWPNLRARSLELLSYWYKRICKYPIEKKPYLLQIRSLEKYGLLLYSIVVNLFMDSISFISFQGSFIGLYIHFPIRQTN